MNPWLFALLLQLYPRQLRQHYGQAMQQTHQDAWQDAQENGQGAAFFWTSWQDLFISLWQSHLEVPQLLWGRVLSLLSLVMVAVLLVSVPKTVDDFIASQTSVATLVFSMVLNLLIYFSLYQAIMKYHTLLKWSLFLYVSIAFPISFGTILMLQAMQLEPYSPLDLMWLVGSFLISILVFVWYGAKQSQLIKTLAFVVTLMVIALLPMILRDASFSQLLEQSQSLMMMTRFLTTLIFLSVWFFTVFRKTGLTYRLQSVAALLWIFSTLPIPTPADFMMANTLHNILQVVIFSLLTVGFWIEAPLQQKSPQQKPLEVQ
jgi:hypothetical protein